MNKKYIYIFTNTHTKFIKIGKTDNLPEIRADQLNKQTGTIGKYEVAWHKDVPNNTIAENMVHYCLKDFNVGKEYFDLNKEIAIEICEDILNFYFDKIEKHNEKLKIEIEKAQIAHTAKERKLRIFELKQTDFKI